jgi:AcrR family transcriptional regulator
MQRTLAKPKPVKSRAVRSATRKSKGQRSVIPPGQVDSPQRRRDILLAAAELFSIHGYNGVSLRDIAKRARVPTALCGYYFGRKSELFACLFLHSPDHIEKRRAALQAFAEGSLEDLVRLWIEPVMKMRSDAEEAPFAVLSARASWDSSVEAKEAVKRFYDPIAFAVLRALKRLLPNRDPADLAWGYEWALGAFLMHLGGSDRIESLSQGCAATEDAGVKTGALIRFVCAGLRSIPASTRTVKTNN